MGCCVEQAVGRSCFATFQIVSVFSMRTEGPLIFGRAEQGFSGLLGSNSLSSVLVHVCFLGLGFLLLKRR